MRAKLGVCVGVRLTDVARALEGRSPHREHKHVQQSYVAKVVGSYKALPLTAQLLRARGHVRLCCESTGALRCSRNSAPVRCGSIAHTIMNRASSAAAVDSPN